MSFILILKKLLFESEDFVENKFATYRGDIIYLNANNSNIRSILRNNGNWCVRFGVVDVDEIYYWDCEFLHSKVSEFIKKDFKLKLAYSGERKIIADASAQDDKTDTPEKYPLKNKLLFQEIRSKIEEVFPGVQIPDYLENN